MVPEQQNGSPGDSVFRMLGDGAAWPSIPAEAGACPSQFGQFGEVTP